MRLAHINIRAAVLVPISYIITRFYGCILYRELVFAIVVQLFRFYIYEYYILPILNTHV